MYVVEDHRDGFSTHTLTRESRTTRTASVNVYGQRPAYNGKVFLKLQITHCLIYR